MRHVARFFTQGEEGDSKQRPKSSKRITIAVHQGRLKAQGFPVFKRALTLTLGECQRPCGAVGGSLGGWESKGVAAAGGCRACITAKNAGFGWPWRSNNRG